MQVTNAEQMIEKAKFNKKFHGNAYYSGVRCLMMFDGFDLTVYGAVVPTLMEEWNISPVEAGLIGKLRFVWHDVRCLYIWNTRR